MEEPVLEEASEPAHFPLMNRGLSHYEVAILIIVEARGPIVQVDILKYMLDSVLALPNSDKIRKQLVVGTMIYSCVTKMAIDLAPNLIQLVKLRGQPRSYVSITPAGRNVLSKIREGRIEKLRVDGLLSTYFAQRSEGKNPKLVLPEQLTAIVEVPTK